MQTARDFRSALKVKIKNLADEAWTIRKEEEGARTRSERISLAHHRRTVVRTAARDAQLAYAFIRGKSFRDVCPGRRHGYDYGGWDRVRRLVGKYGLGSTEVNDKAFMKTDGFHAAVRDQRERLDAWIAGARAYTQDNINRNIGRHQKALRDRRARDAERAKFRGIGGRQYAKERQLA